MNFILKVLGLILLFILTSLGLTAFVATKALQIPRIRNGLMDLIVDAFVDLVDGTEDELAKARKAAMRNPRMAQYNRQK